MLRSIYWRFLLPPLSVVVLFVLLANAGSTVGAPPAQPNAAIRPESVKAWRKSAATVFRRCRALLPATKRHAKRIDYEYERAGTASIFMFTEPLAGLA